MAIRHNEYSLMEWMNNESIPIEKLLQKAVSITEMVYDLHNQQEKIGALSPANLIIEVDTTIVRLAEMGERSSTVQ